MKRIKHIFENGIIVADCSGDSVQYRLKDFVCHFDGKLCERFGWCVRKDKDAVSIRVGNRVVPVLDYCVRYPFGSAQKRLVFY